MIYGADLQAQDYYGRLPIDMGYRITEMIRKAIRDELRRRMDQTPGKRATEPDSSATPSVALKQDEDEHPGEQSNEERVKLMEGKVAEEDEDSEPSDDEDGH